VAVCTHLDQIEVVTPSGNGCQECLELGDTWVHLRLCMIRTLDRCYAMVTRRRVSRPGAASVLRHSRTRGSDSVRLAGRKTS